MKKIDRLRNETYEEALKLLDKKKKCAIIRPTGFGKTGILTKFIKSGHYKKILYLYPTDVVKQAVFNFYYGKDYKLLMNSYIPDVTFMTYQKVTQLTEKDMEAIRGTDLIICDEYHRIGAPETMDGLRSILNDNKRAKLLGASATPDRMDMIDVTAMFFNDITTSKYTLHDAIQDGIIKKPYYCYCDFDSSDPNVVANIKKDIMLKVNVDDEDEDYARELLNGKMIELANLNRMDANIKMALKTSKIKTNYQKYIVFFSNFAHMKDKQRAVRRWFATAYPKHKIRETIVSSETTEYAKNVKKLCKLKSKDKTIDLIYSCEMLNMGYHVDNLTGIIMYRSTYSNTVYAQQLGRALSTGDARPKIVFDVVDNVHRKSKYIMFVSNKEAESGVPDAILEEYKALVKKQNSKNKAGNPVKLTQEETDRLVELKKIIAKHKKRTPKSGSLYNINQLYYDDLNLIATGNEATYREFIGKAVAEIEAIPCRRAWERWVEKGGDCRVMTRDYILAQKAPKAVPLPPFCRAKNVAVQAVLDVMGVK